MPKNPKQTDIYLQRLNIVINHIRENSTQDLSLNELAQVAGFSPFHFHRLFKSLTNETVSDMVTRFRLERAASLLRASPRLSITDAAFECGFRSVSVFSRTFKKYYDMNALLCEIAQLLQSIAGKVLRHFTILAVFQWTLPIPFPGIHVIIFFEGP